MKIYEDIGYLEHNKRFEEAYELLIENRKKILKILTLTNDIKEREILIKEYLFKNLRLYNDYEELIKINDPFILQLKNYSEYDDKKQLNLENLINCLNKIVISEDDTLLNKLKKEYLILELEIIKECLKK